MKFLLTPKTNGYYGLKVDSVALPVDEATLQYILNDRLYDGVGIKQHNEKTIITLQNGSRFGVPNKKEFLIKLKKAHEEVTTNNSNSSFEIGEK